MKAVHLRPLCLLCLLFYFVSAFLYRGSTEKLIAGIILMLISVVLLVIHIKNKTGFWLRSISIAVMAISVAFCFTSVFIDAHAAKDLQYEGDREIKGRITEVKWLTSYEGSYIARLTEIDGKEADVKIVLTSALVLERGDVFSGEAYLYPIGTTDSFDSGSYYTSNGIYLQAQADNIKYEKTEKTFVDKLLDLNERLSARLVLLMGEKSGGIASAVFLGNDKYLSAEFDSAMKNMGISHLTALSGMHLTVVCTMLGLFTSRLGRKASFAAICFPITMYIILTGFSASILRAGIMLLCLNLISLLGRDTDMPTNLGMTVMLICIFDHYAIYDIGLQLSVAAMLGIAAAVKLTREDVYHPDGIRIRNCKRFLFPLCIGFFAMFFTMPLVSHYFDSFSLASFIMTIPYSFAVTAILWLTPFVLLLYKLPIVNGIVSAVCKLICSIMYDSAVAIGFDNAWTVSEDSIFIEISMILFVLSVGIVAVVDTKKARRICAVVSAILLALFLTVTAVTVNINLNKVTVCTTESTGGEGFAVRHRDGRVLVDISRGSKNFSYSLASTASQLNIHTADVLIIADPHASHKRSLDHIQGYVKIKTVLMPDTEEAHLIGESLDMNVSYYNGGDIFDFGTYKLVTYEDKYISRSVVPIVRFKIETKEDDLFYAGSAVNEIEFDEDTCKWMWLGGYGPKYKCPVDNIYCDNLIISQKAKEFIPYKPSAEIGEKINLTK